ncbi:MAG: HAD family hydrolase [Armatimonadetes bacterium]|nr:HAD family hydrolase [Armatimonadota bacterium]
MAADKRTAGEMLPGANYIEIINPDIERGRIRFALFDFDGTISLIREGWQGVMIPMMVEVLAELGTGETRDELYEVVRDYVTRLTGKQTIYQMIELAEQVKKRGGTPKEPLEYKWDYLRLLWARIEDRVKGLKEGRLTPEEMSVPGSLDMVAALKERGVTLYLASGTDRPYVLDEAACLGLNPYFGENIYGALDDYKSFSKAMLIQRIIEEHDLHGSEFAAFGDGFVEIENAKEVGGIAVGVASNEASREGIDQWKRNRLIEAGADIIIPDFREWRRLIAYLWAEDEPCPTVNSTGAD